MTGRAVALGLAAFGLLAGAAVPAHADPAVTCVYQVDDWAGGFSANLALTNHGAPVSGWTVQMTFPSATSGLHVWNAAMTLNTPYDATATNMSWNGTIATGQVVSFGWTATAATTGPPTSMTINGAAC